MRTACVRQVSRPWKTRLAALAALSLCGLAAPALLGPATAAASGAEHAADIDFPRSLESYDDGDLTGIGAILSSRASAEPFNVVATLIFLLAIAHTFTASRFLAVAHRWDEEHARKLEAGEVEYDSVHAGARLFHLLGEVEVIFGMWAVALAVAIVAFFDWPTLEHYATRKVNFGEAMFVVVIMTLASTRPILRLAETAIRGIAGLLGGSLSAQWITTMTVGPLLGSIITEPAAITLSALVLSRILFELGPSDRFKYASVGLLFVNVSVGGTLTNFAAPPVLMVAGPWGWSTGHMLADFGWKAAVGIVLSNGLYFFLFRQELARLQEQYVLVRLKGEIKERGLRHGELTTHFRNAVNEVEQERQTVASIAQQIESVAAEVRERLAQRYVPELVQAGADEDLARKAFEERFEDIKLRALREEVPHLLELDQRASFEDPDWDKRDDPVPVWVTVVHLLFLGWTIVNAHHPELFVPGMLFFLGFANVTESFQNRVNLRPAMLVGFFLGGLVFHGGVQAWWIAPILGNLAETPLMLGATVLTAFNDNAAITFLATLVPGFTDELKHAVVAGAVAGGGLTIIANAPNPAAVSILKGYFQNGVGAAGILRAALLPTAICWLLLWLIP